MMKLKEARNRANLTQLDVSEITSIPLGTLRRWEQGVNEPSTDDLLRLADLYHVSVDYILGSRYAADTDSDTLTADERRLVELYRSADSRGKAAIIRTAVGESGMGGNATRSVAQAG